VIGPGKRNLITDVPGLTVGHADDARVGTGVTVIRCNGEWVGAVDARGGGPGLRETETLQPENVAPGVHAIVLSGGSVFGLAAADGVAAALSAEGIGLRLRPGSKAIPIVPAAVLHDLHGPGDKQWDIDPPYRRLGIEAVAAAGPDVALGSVGAGFAAMVGYRKGGIGSTSVDLGNGLIVGALAAANAVGTPYMPDGRTFWAWPFEMAGEFGGFRPAGDIFAHDPVPDLSRLAALDRLQPGGATTLAVVAVNARLSKAEAKRVAIMAQDGMARALRPIHTPFDGDVVFALAGGDAPLAEGGGRNVDIARIGSAAADCLARAIARGVYVAEASAGAAAISDRV